MDVLYIRRKFGASNLEILRFFEIKHDGCLHLGFQLEVNSANSAIMVVWCL